MKQIYIFLTAFLLLSSCSKDEEGGILVPQEPEETNTSQTDIVSLEPRDKTIYDSDTTALTLLWKAHPSATSYDLYFGVGDIGTEPYESNITDTNFDVTNLKAGTNYVWKVVVEGAASRYESPLMSFSITEVSISEQKSGVYIEWDNVASSYDIYLGKERADTKVASGITLNSYFFDDLEAKTIYNYKIVPKGSSHVFEERAIWYTEGSVVRVFDGDVRLVNQEQIDAFALRGFNQITGTLLIESDYQRNIRSLESLSWLTRVGNLHLKYIYNLESLVGLHNLRVVRGYCIFKHLQAVTNIDLPKLYSIYGNLNIITNASLQSLKLDSLIRIGGDFILGGRMAYGFGDWWGYSAYELDMPSGNPVLSEVSMPKLTSIGQSVSILNNDALENLYFLSGITGLYADLVIARNDNLTTLSGLKSCTAVAQSVVIIQNDSLMGTGGLENLSIAGLGIVIAENDSLDYILLTDLETTSHLYIGDNPKLKYITSMNHLRNLGKMAIYRNTSLSNYCNLRSFYTSGITIESHRLFGNKYNPSISQLASTSYCSN